WRGALILSESVYAPQRKIEKTGTGRQSGTALGNPPKILRNLVVLCVPPLSHSLSLSPSLSLSLSLKLSILIILNDHMCPCRFFCNFSLLYVFLFHFSTTAPVPARAE